MWNAAFAGKGSKALEGGESIAEVMSNEGLSLIKGDNDRVNGIQRYRDWLAIAPDGLPWYQVFSSCYDTIRTIPALVYDRHREEDVDTDGEDHCYDRDRYFFMSRPAKPERLEKPQYNPIRSKYRLLVSKKEELDEEEEFIEDPYLYY